MNTISQNIKFGYGLFETMLVEDKRVIDLRAHLERLRNGLKALKMPLFDMDLLTSNINKIINQEKEDKFAIRVTCSLVENSTQIDITTRSIPYTVEMYNEGYGIKLSSIKRHSENPIYQIKSNNGINNYQEMMDIKQSHFDEALHLNEKNQICECIYSNIFFVKDEFLYTPHVECGLLPGIMRQKVIDHAKKIGITVNIGYYSIEKLQSADEVFLTNALLGIMPVKMFDTVCYDLDSVNITKRLIKEMF